MKKLLLFFLGFQLFFGCQTSPDRTIDNTRVQYDLKNVAALKTAIQNGILFNLPESLVDDANSKEAGPNCRRVSEPSWTKELTTLLVELNKKPELYNKFHIIEIKRGDSASVEVQEDLDGARSLQIIYAKSELRKNISSLAEIPCAEVSMELVGKEMREIIFKYPTFADVQKQLTAKNDKKSIDRLKYEKKFLNFLAEKMTILRFSADLSFEMNSKGESLLNSFTKNMDEQFLVKNTYKELEFWLAEISNNGFATQNIKVFELKKDVDLSHGVKIENADKYSRKTEDFGFPTPFISYKSEQGEFRYSSIQLFEKCLSQLRKNYNRYIASASNYNIESKFFLYPGLECR